MIQSISNPPGSDRHEKAEPLAYEPPVIVDLGDAAELTRLTGVGAAPGGPGFA